MKSMAQSKRSFVESIRSFSRNNTIFKNITFSYTKLKASYEGKGIREVEKFSQKDCGVGKFDMKLNRMKGIRVVRKGSWKKQEVGKF